MAQLTNDEVKMIKMVFKDNENLMIAVRKVFYPAFDENAKIGEQVDLYLNCKVDDMPPEQAVLNIKARTLLINHIEGGLNKLKALSEATEDSEQEIIAKAKKNSAK